MKRPVLILLSSLMLWLAQSQSIVGTWQLKSQSGDQLKLSFFQQDQSYLGFFESQSIGTATITTIEVDRSTVKFEVAFAGNYKVGGDFNISKEQISGKLTIQQQPPAIYSGERTSMEVDLRAQHSEPSFSPKGKELAFVSDSLGNKDIVTTNRVLVGHEANDWGISWSPDGSSIAFLSDRSSAVQIFTVDLKTLKTERISDDSISYANLDWSPDGKSIACTSKNGIHLFDVETKESQILVKAPDCYTPRFSPDSKQIVYTARMDNAYNLFIYDLTTSQLLNFTATETPDFNGRYSPDQKSILWISRRDGNPEVYLKKLRTSELIRITNNDHRDNNPRWSRNGKMVVWEARPEGNPEIRITWDLGKRIENLTNHPASDTNPQLSADGKFVAFVSDRIGVPRVCMLELKTGKLQVF